MTLPIYVQGSWFLGAALFIFGLKGMSSPASARKGIVIAGYGMLIAIAGTFLVPGLQNLALMLAALVLGGAAAWISGQKVKMTDMPQMVAIYNGMGGGAAAAIAAIEFAKGDAHSLATTVLAVIGALIGAVSFTGSCVAWAKLQGVLKKAHRLPAQNAVNIVLALIAIGLGGAMVVMAHEGCRGNKAPRAIQENHLRLAEETLNSFRLDVPVIRLWGEANGKFESV